MAHPLKNRLHHLLAALPLGDDLQSAYLLAEIACYCHVQLNRSRPWRGESEICSKRLDAYLRDSSDGVSNLANDLWYATEDLVNAGEAK
jgi:hypothetical protein